MALILAEGELELDGAALLRHALEARTPMVALLGQRAG